MNINDYKAYISEETLMGPNSVRILAELFNKYPLHPASNDRILDLGCGTGLTSLIIAKETGAKVYANDLWVSAEENGKRFVEWGVGEQITPICEDANNLHFEKSSSMLWLVLILIIILREIRDSFRKRFCHLCKIMEWF